MTGSPSAMLESLGRIMLGERVVAFVSAEENVTAKGVQAWCAARLAGYRAPAEVVVASEPLPRNANGKLQKAVLRERARDLRQAVRA